MSLLEMCQWIQDTQVATTIRESLLLFPFIEGTHVLGLGLSVGTIIWFDLRLMGLMMRDVTVSEVFEQVKPWMFLGFVLMFVTGGLLFWSYAARCYTSPYFRAKIALLFVAGLNVLVYHFTIHRRRAAWDKLPIPPSSARLAGLLSLTLWMSIVAVGRLMAYHLLG
jgi:hypothetical protein